MKPRWKVLAVLLAVTASLIGGMFTWSRLDSIGFANAMGFNASAALVGQAVPEFSLREVRTGDTINRESVHGRVVVFAFWATWCPFCQQTLPALERIHEDPALQDSVKVITIDVREEEIHGAGQEEAAVRAYLQDHPYTFPVLLGSAENMAAFRVRAIPAVIVADAGGVIRYAGITQHDEKALREAIASAR